MKVDQRVTGIGGGEGAAATQQIFIEEVAFNTGQAEIAKARENL